MCQPFYLQGLVISFPTGRGKCFSQTLPSADLTSRSLASGQEKEEQSRGMLQNNCSSLTEVKKREKPLAAVTDTGEATLWQCPVCCWAYLMFVSSLSQAKLSFLGETFQSLSVIDVSAETELSRQGGSSEEVRRLLISTKEVPVMIKTCFQYSEGMSVLLEMLTPLIHPDAIHKGSLSVLPFWCPGGC